VSKYNNGVYKLNPKTLKFLKRMGKLEQWLLSLYLITLSRTTWTLGYRLLKELLKLIVKYQFPIAKNQYIFR
jgi:hypothetical protein